LQSYAQLAAALTSAGDRDAANEIRYLGRVRERETEKGLAYVWSGFLQWVAGFGIGTYTFRALYWVIGISFLGALYLKTRVKGREHASQMADAYVPLTLNCFAFDQKPRERCVWMTTKSAFPALGAPTSPEWVQCPSEKSTI
jgi:hypothetical protein